MIHFFILLIVALLREQNINISVSNDTSSDIHQSAEASILAAVCLNIIFLFVEMVLLIAGYSLFYDRLNVVQIFLHLMGILLCIVFVLVPWGYYLIWGIWAGFGLIPFIIEIFIFIGARGLYKAKY
jgi:hypothetical protein